VGVPTLLLVWIVCCRAFFGMRCSTILITCPAHCNFYIFIYIIIFIIISYHPSLIILYGAVSPSQNLPVKCIQYFPCVSGYGLGFSP
jgi:hypothetical protein